PLDGGQPHLIGHTGKCFTYIEGLALSVEVSVIVSFELGLSAQLSAQEPRCQRHARQDPYAALSAQIEQALRRALPKNIVDDLNRTHAGVLDGLHAFLDPLDADSVVPQLPSLYQVVQDPENLGAII